MHYRNIEVDSAITKITSKDTLFSGDYIIDPYKKCEFACQYCDSADTNEILIKTNVPNEVDEELRLLPRGIIILGSVHDPYQPVEKQQKITREVLQVIAQHRFPAHILTKSDLVLRDIDLLQQLPTCAVTISMISDDEQVSRIFEPNVPLPQQRFKMIQQLAKKRINAGMALMPVFPYISDANIERFIGNAKEAGAQYVVWEYLELKGDQRQKTFQIIKSTYPQLVSKYERLYADGYKPTEDYVHKVNAKFSKACKHQGINTHIDLKE